MEETKWKIELTGHQLMLMARCVEDCHRFMAGQTELFNTTCCLKHHRQLQEKLRELKPLITPELSYGESYGWNGSSCPDENQRKFIAETYYLYREIYHQVILDTSKKVDMSWDVYYGDTLTCKDSGEPIKVERIE